MYFDLRLWGFTKGIRFRIGLAVLVGLAGVLLGIARLALLAWLIVEVFGGTLVSELLWPAAGIAVTMVARGGLEYLRTMVAHRNAELVQIHLRTQLFDKMDELGPAHFGFSRTGEAMVAMVDGVEQLEVYFGEYLPQLFISLLTPIAIFSIISFFDLPLALVMLAAALVTLIAPQAFHHLDRKSSFRRSRAYKNFAAEFLDSIQGLPTLKAFAQSTTRIERLRIRADELFRSTMWVLATNSLSRGITDTGIAVGAAVTLGYGAFRVTEGQMELSILVMLLMLGVEVFRPLRDMRALMHNGMVSQASAQTLFGFFDASSTLEEPQDWPGDALEPTVTFRDVHFSYPGGRGTVHTGMDFKVAAGERVGIVGRSGAGKSTIVRLLLRFHDPDAGEVCIGGIDLRALPREEICRQVAVVSQDVYLFHGTVEDNLRIGKPNATQSDYENACRAANIHDFIANLPQGYKTVVGERGIRLSGGQRQRIAIARALLKDAPILVLDEALSSVDAENEAVIQEALEKLMVGRTTLILAHRLSSVIGSDRIFLVENGHVAESGRHRELMDCGGAYARLMAAQIAEGGAGQAMPAGAGGDTTTADADGQNRPVDDLVDALVDDPVDGPAELIGDRPADSDTGIVAAEGLGWFEAAAKLFGHIAPHKGKLAITFTLGITRVFAFIGVGVVSALIVRAVKTGEGFEDFKDLLVWLAVLAPVAGIFHWFESWMAHDMAFRLLADMRIALFRKLDQLAPAYMVRHRSGDMVAMAAHDVEMVEYFFAHTVAPALVAVLVPGTVLVVLGFNGLMLAVTLAPFLLAVVVSPFLMRRRVDVLASRAKEALGELNAHVVDTLQGLPELTAFAYMSERRQEFLGRLTRYHEIREPFLRNLTLQTVFLDVATGLGGLAVVVTGAVLATNGALDNGLLPLFSLLAMAAFLPVSEIANVGRQLADTLGSVRRLHAVDAEPLPVEDGMGMAPPRVSGGGDITFEGVSFRYDSWAKPALDNVSFSVPSGGTLALVGPSGAGKTTSGHLLMRFWDPTEGSIQIDGHDLRQFPLDSLRQRVALVAQETFLFNESLRENILIAKPNATEEELEVAVAKAALGEFIAGLPDGLDTGVGERGLRLSGGQRQRVAIARAFLRDAPVLILDEATSHLDAVNEGVVRAALEELMHDRTTIIIAHRLSTIRNVDRIVVLKEGRMAETGTHRDLVAKGGLYAGLVGRQTAGLVDHPVAVPAVAAVEAVPAGE